MNTSENSELDMRSQSERRLRHRACRWFFFSSSNLPECRLNVASKLQINWSPLAGHPSEQIEIAPIHWKGASDKMPPAPPADMLHLSASTASTPA